MHRAQSGFSLIEIIIVLVLIGIVIALVADRVAGGAQTGKVRATKIQIDTLSGKIETFALDNGSAPDRLEDLVNKPGAADSWMGPYAREKELIDTWNNPIVYRKPGTNGRDFDLYSMGPDGKEGGEGIKAADIHSEY